MASDLIGKLRRGLKKDPRYIARRLVLELRAEAERYLGPRRVRTLTAERLARAAGADSVDAWWARLAALPYPHPERIDAARLEALCPGARDDIVARAERAHAHEVELLGSGSVSLGPEIDWHRDFKTGIGWPPRFHRDIEYTNLERPSDVKLPWELSRLQWAQALGQAWMLDGDERHAEAARRLLDDWIAANPCGASVNWACTMEPALRIIVWSWFFHVFAQARAWRDSAFRGRFLRALYLHGDFVAHNLEEADINGNHYTADAAGLVYAGLFFGDMPAARGWLATGWRILQAEMPRQVFADGVDFEASIPYHRLVLELFAYPALYRLARGLEVDGTYRERLVQMGRFVAAYSRRDGSTPLWGDADDARALAFGRQSINDHRYLLGVLGIGFDAPDLAAAFSGPRDEVAWLLGTEAAARLPAREHGPEGASAAFRQGGFYVLRAADHHVFIDCGPLGLAGRGGHGHNDLLSFELMLHGVKLISDCGAYLYTACATERNNFRSTAYHNTPQIDTEELNRLVRPDYLWLLRNDAHHELLRFETGDAFSLFEGSHDGYRRLADPVSIVRRIELDHLRGALSLNDRFEGSGHHTVRVPFHLAPGVAPARRDDGLVELHAGGRRFAMRASPGWHCTLRPARVSPSYGVTVATQAVQYERAGELIELQLRIEPLP